MKILRIQRVLAALSCVVMVCPTVGAAEMPASAQQTKVTDVALQQNGALVGQVVDQQGVAQANAEVALLSGDQEIARASTNASGYFAMQDIQGGQYLLLSAEGATVVRAWAPNTAPPMAVEAARVIEGDQVMRANGRNSGRSRRFLGLSKGSALGLGVGLAAVGVGFAIALDGDDDNS